MQSVSLEYSQKLTSIQKSLYGFILSMVPNRSEAEDILQETNLILCQKANEYDPGGHFQGWAFKIARFQVLKHMTNVKRSKLQFSTEFIEEVASEEFDVLSTWELVLFLGLLAISSSLLSRLGFSLRSSDTCFTTVLVSDWSITAHSMSRGVSDENLNRVQDSNNFGSLLEISANLSDFLSFVVRDFTGFTESFIWSKASVVSFLLAIDVICPSVSACHGNSSSLLCAVVLCRW